MELTVLIEGRTLQLRVSGSETVLDGEPLPIDLAPKGLGPVRSVRLEGRSLRILPERDGDGGWILELRGRRHRLEVLDAGEVAMRRARARAPDSGRPPPLRAPMPGLVVRIEVQEGELVEAGQGILIVEAMKMENELRASAGGRVRTVRVREGEAVEKDQILIDFESLEVDG